MFDADHTGRPAGWWQASDLEWYPPELHPDRHPALPAPPTRYLPATTTDREFSSADTAQREPAGSRGMQIKHWLIVAVCVAYFLSPVDFFPELLLGPLGVPDDIIAAVAAIGVVVTRVRSRPLTDS